MVVKSVYLKDQGNEIGFMGFLYHVMVGAPGPVECIFKLASGLRAELNGREVRI